MPYKDPERQRAAQATHYQANRGSIDARKNRNRVEHRKVLLQIVKERKSVPCHDCGVPYPPHVMQFDHVRGKKLGNVATMVHDAVPLTRLEEEMEKCEIVCANCHAERTYQRSVDFRCST